MTHEEISYQTKMMLCTSLRELMKHKAFSKITVSELIKECDLNRKTFYYHFEDIYGLLKWMLEQEAFEVVKQFDLLTDFRDAFNFIFDYIEKNACFLNGIYESVGRDELKRFFYNDFIGIIEKFIHDTEAELSVSITDEFLHFICNFYTEGIAGMLIDRFKNPDEYSREALLSYFSGILTSSLPAVLHANAQIP